VGRLLADGSKHAFEIQAGKVLLVVLECRLLFGLDAGKGAEKEVANIGEDGSAAGGDALLSEEDQNVREKFVDLGGGIELVELGGESGKIRDAGLAKGRTSVAPTEMGIGVHDGDAALAVFGGLMLTTTRFIDGAGVRRFGVHFCPQK
jgi:hypothetical protein